MANAYDYIKKTIQKQYKDRPAEYKQRIVSWSKDEAINRIEKPSNIARARTLGYKAKNGYVIIRVRIGKGRRKRLHPMGGRKSRHNYQLVQTQLSHQTIAEQRVNREYKNLEVINSYWVGDNGNYKFFEVIMGDPTLLKLPVLNRTGRAFRGLTSSGRKARGLGRGRIGLGQQRVKD